MCYEGVTEQEKKKGHQPRCGITVESQVDPRRSINDRSGLMTFKVVCWTHY
jgi:hypothetical protein